MTKTQTHDLVLPAPQEKLEWVTPKISLMEVGDTDGIKQQNQNEDIPTANNNFAATFGSS